MTTGDHSAEAEALSRRYPGWTVWFGPFTRRWWALPPRERNPAGFVEAESPQRLIARIEVVQHGETTGHDPGSQVPTRAYSPPDPRQDAHRPSNLLRLEGITPAASRRVPVIVWPGSTAR
ncbi:hypothetical protein [Actinomadura sp. SCN-SB]|uniref:hypothetical protein n=1 Tax=Actinomadura sp. SCN-SB TaxID=3373092 RepID=UPI0037539BEF